MIVRILKLGIFFGIVSSLASCSSVSELKPDDYLSHARALIQKQQFQLAKRYVDSVQICFPKDFAKIREGIAIMREINYAEQTRTLSFCDSMLKVKQTLLPHIQKNFKFEKNDEYETIGHYVHRSQSGDNQLGHTNLQTKVDERGRLILTSYYCGNKALGHNRIRATSTDGTFAETLIVPKDGALNYSFKDGNVCFEFVRFSEKTENGILEFIQQHDKSPIRIHLTGGNTVFSYELSSNDKLVVKEASQLSAVLSDITRLLDEIKLAQAKLEYIRLKQQGAATIENDN
jgi:hypothetical protein